MKEKLLNYDLKQLDLKCLYSNTSNLGLDSILLYQIGKDLLNVVIPLFKTVFSSLIQLVIHDASVCREDNHPIMLLASVIKLNKPKTNGS